MFIVGLMMKAKKIQCHQINNIKKTNYLLIKTRLQAPNYAVTDLSQVFITLADRIALRFLMHSSRTLTRKYNNLYHRRSLRFSRICLYRDIIY